MRAAVIWVLILFGLLLMFREIHGVSLVCGCGIAIVACVLIVRRMQAGKDINEYLANRWRTTVSANLLGMWTALARNLRLEVRQLDGGVVVAGLGFPMWDRWSCLIPVYLPPGLVKEDLVAVAGRIARAFGAVRVSVIGDRLDALVMRVDYADALAEPFWFPLGAAWDGRSVLMGLSEDGAEWRMPLGPHTLVAGASGSGKASLVWGLFLGLSLPIRDGLVEVRGIDRKGGMELAMGRGLLTRFADDAPRAVALLEDAVTQMQIRARELAGVTRQHVATTESPTVIVLIDELAALTAYE